MNTQPHFPNSATSTAIIGVSVLHDQQSSQVIIQQKTMQNHPALAGLQGYPDIHRLFDPASGHFLFQSKEDHDILMAALNDKYIAMVYPEVSASDLAGLRQQQAHALLCSNLDLFIHLSKVPGSFLFDPALREEIYLQHEAPLYFITCAFGSWAWNVPEGYVYFTVCDQFRKSPHHGYLIEKEAYQTLREKRNLPIPHEKLQVFSPDTNMPMYVPDHIDADTYYMVSAKETDHEIMILIYNYAEKSHKQLTMNSVCYQQQGKPHSFKFENGCLVGEISYYAQTQDVNPYQEQDAA